MLDVVTSGCRQGGLKRCRPAVVGLGESPNLVGGQAELAAHRAERLATVDRVEEPLTHLDREPGVCPASKARSRGIILRLTTCLAVAPFQPAGQGAVGRL